MPCTALMLAQVAVGWAFTTTIVRQFGVWVFPAESVTVIETL